MPGRHRVRESAVEIDACIQLKRVDLHRPPEGRYPLDDVAFAR
jgi:hypothetical protein